MSNATAYCGFWTGWKKREFPESGFCTMAWRHLRAIRAAGCHAGKSQSGWSATGKSSIGRDGSHSILHIGLKRLHQEDGPRGVSAEHAEKLRDILARLEMASTIEDMEMAGFRGSFRSRNSLPNLRTAAPPSPPKTSVSKPPAHSADRWFAYCPTVQIAHCQKSYWPVRTTAY